jgi:uncharacterized membrane protein YfcA
VAIRAGYCGVSPLQVFLAALAMAFGALVQGGVGFGGSLVAAPLLVLVDVRLVPGPIGVASLLLNLLIIRGAGDGRPDPDIRWTVVGVVPGTAAAAATLAVLSTRGLSVAFAILVFVGVGLTASGFSLRRTPPTLFGAGVVSGFMGTISSIGGPPVALLYQHDGGPTLRATLPRYFFFSGVLALAALVPVGKLGRAELIDSLALVPGVLVGLRGSRWLAGHVDRRGARPWVLGLSTLAAISVLARELW